MKKISATILIFVMIFALCACEVVGGVDLPPLPTPTPTDAAPMESPAEETPEVTAEPESKEGQTHVIVNVKRTELEGYDPQNGTELILNFSYDTPTVYIDGRDEAATKINEFTAMIDEAYYTGESYGDNSGTGYMNMLTMAEDNYNYRVSAEIEGDMQPLSSSRTVTIERADGKVLTLLYSDYSFMGGAHGSYGSRGYVFDTESGEQLSLAALSADYETLAQTIVNYMVEETESDTELAARLDQMMLEEKSYAELYEPLLRDGSWYLGKEGLVIFSDLYEISSYAAGPIEFCIPYEKLEGVIDEKWIPESAEGTAEFSVIGADEMEDGSMEIVDKLTINAESEELYIMASGRAWNVEITAVEYSGVFYDKGLLWHCSYMEDSALQLVTVMPEGMPNLKLSWTDADGEHSLFISHEGESGNYALVSEDIEAVG